MKWLKADLHTHAKEDKMHVLSYTSKDLIDKAHRLKYDIIALTFHKRVFEGEAYRKVAMYAKRKGMLLIPGCEANIEGKDTLIYNITQKELKSIRTFRDLRQLKIDLQKKGREILVIAPHPYFSAAFMGKFCLGRKLVKNIDIFDAIEYSFLYLKRINRNKRAVKVARRYCKPMVGNGDIHVLDNLDKTYSMIYSRKTVNDVIRAVKNGDIKIVTRPLTVKHVAKMAIFHSFKGKAKHKKI